MKNAAKSFLSHNLFLPFAASRRFIFLYHDISKETEKHFSAEYYSTTPDNFERQINFLSRKFEIVPLNALVTDNKLSGRKHYASVVFDDGFLSVKETAMKILSKNDIPFAVFVNKTAILFDQLWVSNLIIHQKDEKYLRQLYSCLNELAASYDNFASDPVRTINECVDFDSRFKKKYLHSMKNFVKRTYLNPEDVASLYEKGVLIGSHTSDHFRLNHCADEELLLQIEDNKVFLDELLETETKHFAIPFGKKEHYSEVVIEKLRAAGHDFIYSTNPIPFGLEEIANDRFLFPRIGLANNSPEEIMFYINRTFLKKYDL